MLLDGLRHLVSLGNFRILGDVGNVVDLLASSEKPAVLILDWDLSAKETNLLQKCRFAYPGAKLVVVEGSEVDPALSPETQLAEAFLDRKQSMATLVKRLEALSDGPRPG